jgi:hypothetical protein
MTRTASVKTFLMTEKHRSNPGNKVRLTLEVQWKDARAHPSSAVMRPTGTEHAYVFVCFACLKVA